MIYYDIWDLDNAIKYYNLSGKNNPNETYPYIFLATLLMKKSRIEEAKSYLEFALTKEGDIDEVNYNLSLLYAGKGEYDKAIELMENA